MFLIHSMIPINLSSETTLILYLVWVPWLIYYIYYWFWSKRIFTGLQFKSVVSEKILIIYLNPLYLKEKLIWWYHSVSSKAFWIFSSPALASFFLNLEILISWMISDFAISLCSNSKYWLDLINMSALLPREYLKS